MVPLKVPEDFDRRSLHIVRRGGPWYRFHDEDYSPLYFGKGRKYRFDDPTGEYGVMYVAEDEFGAFVETFLRDPELTLLDEEELRKRRLSVIQATGPITLVDVTGKGLQHAGVKGDVSTNSHQEVQPLSRAIYEHPSTPNGIRYRLRHDLSKIGIAVFDRAVPAVELHHEDRGSLLDPSNQGLLGDLLDRYDKSLA